MAVILLSTLLAHVAPKKTQSDETVHKLRAVTQDYAARVGQLETVPDANKERLIRRVEDIRKLLVK